MLNEKHFQNLNHRTTFSDIPNTRKPTNSSGRPSSHLKWVWRDLYPTLPFLPHFSPSHVKKQKQNKQQPHTYLEHFAHKSPLPCVNPKQLFKKIICDDSSLEKVIFTSFCHLLLSFPLPKICTALLLRMELSCSRLTGVLFLLQPIQTSLQYLNLIKN